MRIGFLQVLLFTMIIAACAGAEVLVVYPDGSGEFPTIQHAIDAAATGDIIELADGVFTGVHNRDFNITGFDGEFRSASGDPEITVLDMEGHAIGSAGIGEDLTFSDIGFLNCMALEAHSRRIYFYRCRFESCDGIAAINPAIAFGILGVIDSEITGCYSDQSWISLMAYHVNIVRCHFEENTTILASGRSLTCRESEFVNNGGNNGLLDMGGGGPGTGTIEDCLFTDNQPFALIGMSLFSDEIVVSTTISGCSFVNNDAISIYSTTSGELSVVGCSFVANRGALFPADFMFSISQPAPVAIENCLFAFRPEGPVIDVFDVAPILNVTCTDIFGNAEGDWTGPLAPFEYVNGNFSLDPQFCDWPGGDITLFDSSPCLPANNDCGVLIGAEGEGCTATAVADEAEATPRLRLAAATPNPFNPKTRLQFQLSSRQRVSLVIFDATGRCVARLIDGELREAGRHELDWQAVDAAGRTLPSGVYLALLEVPGARDEQKLILLR